MTFAIIINIGICMLNSSVVGSLCEKGFVHVKNIWFNISALVLCVNVGYCG